MGQHEYVPVDAVVFDAEPDGVPTGAAAKVVDGVAPDVLSQLDRSPYQSGRARRFLTRSHSSTGSLGQS